MCAVTLETVYTVADVLPVMAVVKGFAAPNLLELAILHLLSLAVPLLTFPLRTCEWSATSELCGSNDVVES